MAGSACLVCLMAAHRKPVELSSDFTQSLTSPLRPGPPFQICLQAHSKALIFSKHGRADGKTPVPLSSVLKPVLGEGSLVSCLKTAVGLCTWY